MIILLDKQSPLCYYYRRKGDFFMSYTTKDSLINALKEQLSIRDNQAIKGLLTIYSYQTSEEQNDGYTKEYNGVGFSSIDSDILSSFAEQYQTKGWLSPKQMNIVKKHMPKYARQLIELSIRSGKIIKENGEYVFVK